MATLIIVVVIIEVFEYYTPDPTALRNEKEMHFSSYGETQTMRSKIEDGRASTELKGSGKLVIITLKYYGYLFKFAVNTCGLVTYHV